MQMTREELLAWEPETPGYDRDDLILAAGMRSAKVPISFTEVLEWLGPPDKVTGTQERGHAVYFFEEQDQTAAFFDFADAQLQDFGTVTRHTPNSWDKDKETGEKIHVNMLDRMHNFAGSKMAAE